MFEKSPEYTVDYRSTPVINHTLQLTIAVCSGHTHLRRAWRDGTCYSLRVW